MAFKNSPRGFLDGTAVGQADIDEQVKAAAK